MRKIVTALALCVLCSCNSKKSQCAAMEDAARTMENLKPPGTDPKAWEALADAIDGVATKMRAIKLSDAKLDGFRNELVQTFGALAGFSREIAPKMAAGRPDPAWAQVTMPKVMDLQRKADVTVKAYEAYCKE